MITAFATDLYQLTMAAGYWRAGMLEPATFELFVRRLPPNRSYLIAAGLDDALAYLEQLRFDPQERDWLRAQPQFARVPAAFFDEYLARFAFTGDVCAMPEGTPLFANEPVLRVTAPLPEAQIVETALLSIVGFATSVASKASRIVGAAGGRRVVEFGARRAHGLEAALAASRAAYVGGCDGTSFVEAARRYGIPASGTMAHSWVQSFEDETESFREFHRSFADVAVYLLDTYDIDAATRALVEAGLNPPMVRIDSGDVPAISRRVRAALDAGGLTSTRIFITGDLDENAIAALVADGAPVDGFGVGTALTTVSDAPALSAVYKLVEVRRRGSRVGVVKLSAGKQTWPGAKQVWRRIVNGVATGDMIAASDEPRPSAESIALLETVMTTGRRTQPGPPLDAIRERCRAGLNALPTALRGLAGGVEYPVTVSRALDERRLAVRGRHVAS